MRRWLFVGAVLALVLGLVAAVVWHAVDAPGKGLAGEAEVTASSTAPGTSARDLVTSGDADRPGAGWRCGCTSESAGSVRVATAEHGTGDGARRRAVVMS